MHASVRFGVARRAYHRAMPPTAPDADLRRALEGVRAFILDADGVLMYRNVPIPGSPEALVELRRRGIPYRVVTNFSSAHRSSLAAAFGKVAGIPVDHTEIITAASAAAAYTGTHHEGQPLLVLAAPDALREWAGQDVLTPAAADAGDAPVAAVVVGDAGDDLSFANLDIAFRQLRKGAAFVAMHRNPWWMTPKGFTLDAGAVVAGLEFALGRRAVVCGKPSPVVFRQAIAELGTDLRGRGEPRLRTFDVAMVGDDPKADIAAARRVGLRAFLTLTGKTSADDAAVHDTHADAISPSLQALVTEL